MAKETVDAIFDSQMPVATSAVAAHGRIQGIGGGSAPPQRYVPSEPSVIDSAMSRIKEQFQAHRTRNSLAWALEGYKLPKVGAPTARVVAVAGSGIQTLRTHVTIRITP